MSDAAPAFSATLDRRFLLAGMIALPLAAVSRAVAAPLAELALYGPPAGPSIVLAHAAASGTLSHLADNVSFRVWRNPDEMRAGITSGAMQALVLPVQTAANLYNRGLGVRLLNVMTEGLLYVISTDRDISGFQDLKGRRLAVPFRNDTPDLILNRLLAYYGIVPGADIQLEITGSPIEAIQTLLAGRVDAVLAPEPAISAAILRGLLAGKMVARVIDVQQAWGEASGGASMLPQAGLALTDAFAADNPGIADSLQEALQKAVLAVNADPQQAAMDAADAFELPAPVIAASIPTSRLVATRASEVRPQIEAMLAMLSEADPALIGGRLPDDGFYL